MFNSTNKEEKKTPKDYLIVALDTSSEADAIKTVVELKDHVSYFKVGLELFTAVGPRIITILKDLGDKVFLDLKFHDIPNTVSKSFENLVRYEADMVNLHISGGLHMISNARNAVIQTAQKMGHHPPKVLGVTVLTSISSEAMQNDMQVNKQIEEYVLNQTKLALATNLDGIICSPKEAKMIREATNEEFLIVTPGVRPTWASLDDQLRVATPKEAILNGASQIVIGRPITKAKDPKDAAKKVCDEIQEAIDVLEKDKLNA